MLYTIVARCIAFVLGFSLCAVLVVANAADGAEHHPVARPTRGSDGAEGGGVPTSTPESCGGGIRPERARARLERSVRRRVSRGRQDQHVGRRRVAQ